MFTVGTELKGQIHLHVIAVIFFMCVNICCIYNYSCMACKMPNHVSGVKMPLVASTSRDFSTTYIANGKFYVFVGHFEKLPDGRSPVACHCQAPLCC